MTRQGRTPDVGDGGSKDQEGARSAYMLQPTSDIPAPVIVCRYANRSGAAAACGAFDAEHHARAAAAGRCCVDLAFSAVGQDDLDQAPTVAPVDDWPPFEPTDEDIPGGAW